MRRFLTPVLGAIVLLLGVGCSEKAPPPAPSVAEPTSVRVVTPMVRTITRVVGQPSFVESYERTSIFPKLTAYIEKWNVDIGDKVKKGDTLATLFVPEVVEDSKTKKATVELDKQRIELATVAVKVAEADVKAAEARLDEAKANLGQFDAIVERWTSEVSRLSAESSRGVVAPQILLESQKQLKSNVAQRDAAKATISKAESELLSRKAAKDQAVVAVEVARAALAVAESDAKRLEAWVGYLTLTAPFDGVITARNANTGDFVLPATGDPSSDARSPHLSPSGSAAPIYIVDRTDIIRVFVDIPEGDANFVQIGTPAEVFIKAYSNLMIQSTVTRTAWALNVKSRTLRAEIDLPNKDMKILPGMYAYGKIRIERPDVRAIPVEAVVRNGDLSYCWVNQNGKAVRMDVGTGISDGQWVEVIQRQFAKGNDLQPEAWQPIDGTESVILGDLSLLKEGSPVRIETEKK